MEAKVKVYHAGERNRKIRLTAELEEEKGRMRATLKDLNADMDYLEGATVDRVKNIDGGYVFIFPSKRYVTVVADVHGGVTNRQLTIQEGRILDLLDDKVYSTIQKQLGEIEAKEWAVIVKKAEPVHLKSMVEAHGIDKVREMLDNLEQ